jgi:glycosyltransferase involved in cell wall biosynthesis
LEVVVQSLLCDAALTARYQRGYYSAIELLQAYAKRVWTLLRRRPFSLIWIEKESLPWWPLWIERLLLRGVPYVLDYDDADFHNYDLHKWAWVRWAYGRRIDGLMAGAVLVVAGNSYLAQRARDAGARRVEVLPTVIDLARYSYEAMQIQKKGLEPLRIVWIGSPCTAHYLDMIREPLTRLSARVPFVLRVVGGGAFEIAGVSVEVIDWTEDTEVKSLSECDVGIMPLLNTPWEEGKCGYKLIQYMACGLPVVASRIGANVEIVQESMTGYLASNADDWVSALTRLLVNKELRWQMGTAGRLRVEEKYCVQQTAQQLSKMLLTCAISI